MLVEIAHEADAVGVVAGELPVLPHGNGVAGADEPGGGREVIHDSRHSGLVRHGDVEASHLECLQSRHALLHLIQGDLKGQVGCIHPGAGKAVVVHGGGAGVAHGRANEAIELGMAGNSAIHGRFLLLYSF